MEEKDLTAWAHLVQAARSARESRRYYESEAAKYKRVEDECNEQLGKLMGDAKVGIVNGKEVLKRTVTDQFAWARFRAENPAVAADYLVPKLTDEIDKEKLKSDLPDLYERYCTVRWTNNAEVL